MPMNTDPVGVAQAVAAGRMGLAAAFCLTPGLALRAWPGHGAHTDPVAVMLARSVGARDLALGLGTLIAVRRRAPLRGWLEAGVLADLGDAAAIVLAAPRLPRVRSIMAFTSAAGAVIAGQWIIRSMPVSGDGGIVEAAGGESV